MENRTLMSVMEAEEAYKKFLKSARGIFGFSFKKKENLKSFSEIQKEENAYNSVNLGIKEVSLDKIVGSVEKYADFDKNFVPKNNVIKQRWINIYIGYTSDSMLPMVILYKIKDNYYVYDGNHRVSVAKFLNFATIEAQVEEFLPTKDTKDKVIYRERMIFEKETGLSDISLSEPIKYKYLQEEIESYKILLNKRKIENTDLKEASKKWYVNVFLPIKTILSKNEIIKNYDYIKDVIKENTKNWAYERIGIVERALLIVATYEFIFKNAPIEVVANEIVELAKEYGNEKSYEFINGILANIEKSKK